MPNHMCLGPAEMVAGEGACGEAVRRAAAVQAVAMVGGPSLERIDMQTYT